MQPSRLLVRGLLVALALSVLSVSLHASDVDLTILNPNRIGVAGDVITFQGTVTNNSGLDLASTDLFLNFSGYDAANVTLDQLLGSTDFTIPDGMASSTVDLFTFTLAGTAGPGVYPADVVLEDVSGDLSDPQTVTVTILTPEPGSFGLLLTGVVAVLLPLRRRIKLVLPVLLMAIMCSQLTMAQVSAVKFVTGMPGLGVSGGTFSIATPVTNNGTATGSNVQVTSATLKGMAATNSFPMVLGTIVPGQSQIIQADFNSGSLTPNTPYLLTLRGTYQVGGATGGFSVNRYVRMPPPSPGSNTVGSGSADAILVTGAPFPPQPPTMENEVNLPRPPVPTGPFVPGTPTPTETALTQFPSPIITFARPEANASVVFGVNSGVGTTGAGTNCNPGKQPASCAEPSGASGGGVVFVTANWTAAYSTNGGSTFTQINPTTIFPADAVGFCCDQQVQYAPSIDRFLWLLQGPGGMRLASASPAQIVSSGGTAWTYWNLEPTTIGQPAGTGFDYPDTSVGTNSLYLSWDVGFPNCPAGCTSGLEVLRIPLAQIQASQTIFFNYTHPADSSQAWGSHLTQDTGDEIFWAGHNKTDKLQVFSWAEGSNTYFWRDVGITSWANNTLSAPTPDGNDFFLFGFPGHSVIGATRSSNQLWFGWTSGTDENFQQAHIDLVTLDRANNFNKIQQVQIWNNSFAFGYPALATTPCTGEVGLSLAVGGGGSYENHAVGFWGDFVVYTTTNSSSGVNRYGDYLTIRQNGISDFSALGYGISTVSGNMQSDVRYVVFGRPCVIG